MIIHTIDEYIASLALAISSADKKRILELDSCKTIDWAQVPQKILNQVNDMFESVAHLFV